MPDNETARKDRGVTVAPEDVINEILSFCAQGQVGRDLLSQADYAGDMQRQIGHQPGVARSALANKQARQTAHMAAGLAQFLARRYAPGVVDDGDLDKVEAALVEALSSVTRPDGVTTDVDEDGRLSALGGNLPYNDAVLITESGTWVAPVTGWYWVWLISGGCGGRAGNGQHAWGADGCYSGFYRPLFDYLVAGQEVPVTIGAGGIGGVLGVITGGEYAGGHTIFGAHSSYDYLGDPAVSNPVSAQFKRATSFYKKGAFSELFAPGAGLGGGYATYSPLNPNTLAGQNFHNEGCDAQFWGGSGGAYVHENGFCCYGNGKQGAVIAIFHNPAKAAGPVAAPALFMARMAARGAAQPATVNLYDPETGQGSVWKAEDADAKLAEGLITQEAWSEICAAKAAEERAAWLVNPDTEPERFEMLRQARDARLSATDYLVAPDYPLADAQRAEFTAYRQALRDLPAQTGAPWDGGGELTPWPEMPVVSEVAF